jgi:nucleotide-binding universal stress UspA family protein
MIYNKILVALDNSLQAGKVLQTAINLAQESGGELKLLHCLNSSYSNQGMPSIGTIGDIDMYGTLHNQYQQQLKEEIEKVSSWLEYCCQTASIRSVPATFTHRFGNPGKEICSFAKSWGADVIILGRRGHGGITELFLGSVSNYVLHHAHCSVLVVQDKLTIKDENKLLLEENIV